MCPYLDGCESDLSDVTVDTDTLLTCEPMPEGVRSSATATTLQSFDIEAGYYRISTESPIVLSATTVTSAMTVNVSQSPPKTDAVSYTHLTLPTKA